ncbi:MAG: hypothetical protein KDK27_12410 [Leptospiraceae bacterium]|nr:hypothetical protein [Leptospiraceae bacterium]
MFYLLLVLMPIVRPYDITDPRFCWITPQPFACQRCLQDGQQFVQILEFESDGRPIRSYACRAWERPYLR